MSAPPPDDQVDQLARLLDALAAEPDPPTTVTAPADAARVHLADSLSALDLDDVAGASRIADIGAGAGFPGLALAVALPAPVSTWSSRPAGSAR